MNIVQTSVLPQLLDHRSVNAGFPRQSDQLGQGIKAAPQTVNSVVGQKIVQIVVTLVREAVTGLATKIAWNAAAMLERLQFQHGQVEIPPVETDQGAGEAFLPFPEGSH